MQQCGSGPSFIRSRSRVEARLRCWDCACSCRLTNECTESRCSGWECQCPGLSLQRMAYKSCSGGPEARRALIKAVHWPAVGRQAHNLKPMQARIECLLWKSWSCIAVMAAQKKAHYCIRAGEHKGRPQADSQAAQADSQAAAATSGQISG